MLEDTGFGYEGMKTRVSLIISINFKVHILFIHFEVWEVLNY